MILDLNIENKSIVNTLNKNSNSRGLNNNNLKWINDGKTKRAAVGMMVKKRHINKHELIPNGYFHELGESGTGLSGGQLQRLDITRGIVSQKPIMILDEPTSNLDDKNAKEILLSLYNINKYQKNYYNY